MNNKFLSHSSLLVAIAAFLSQPASKLNAETVAGSAYQKPIAVSQPAPDYSYDLRRDGVEGRVVVSFTVTPSGEVAAPSVISSTDGRLVQPTLRALSKWKYVPATKAGVPVTSRIVETVAYTISD